MTAPFSGGCACGSIRYVRARQSRCSGDGNRTHTGGVSDTQKQAVLCEC
jgi:hypothetical protein